MVRDQKFGEGFVRSSHAWEQPWAGSEDGSGRRGRWGLGSQDGVARSAVEGGGVLCTDNPSQVRSRPQFTEFSRVLGPV